MVTRCTRKQENDIPDTDIRLSQWATLYPLQDHTLLAGPTKSEFRMMVNSTVFKVQSIILERKSISIIACITGEEWLDTSACIIKFLQQLKIA
jgi:hypothetical protein